MVFARSAAMAFNRYLDREFDAKNPRTAIREIPSGIISPSSALRFTILNSILFVGFAFMINITCFLLSPIALIIILGYSYTKRFTALCHVVLGLGLSLAPAGAFIAVTESINPSVVLLSLAVIGWVSGFDIIYSFTCSTRSTRTGARARARRTSTRFSPTRCCAGPRRWRWHSFIRCPRAQGLHLDSTPRLRAPSRTSRPTTLKSHGPTFI